MSRPWTECGKWGLPIPLLYWEIRLDDERAGYYAANDEGVLLQFYVIPAFAKHAPALFECVVAQDTLTKAVVSTIDPTYLSLCLDLHNEVTVHLPV